MPRGDQIKVTLECSVCGKRNYSVKKNKRSVPDHFVLKKYCDSCRRHTEHRMGK